MRFAPLWLAVLAACAHGKDAGTVDAGEDAPASTQDSDTSCGGLQCDAVYVSKTGNDSAQGTRADPLKTINAGIAKASARMPAVPVYVGSGEYDETVTMKAGVDVWGGYDASWMPSTTATEIVGPSSGAVLIDQITSATALHKVTVVSGDATAAGASSYAVIVTGSRMITLDSVTVTPGKGGDGVSGNGGVNGGGGGPGAAGGPGVEHSSVFCDSHTVPSGGGGGGSPCGMTGGRGGDPGVGDGGGANGATVGNAGGGAGGAGGGHSGGICNGGNRTAGDGLPGAPGGAGGNGTNGVGGMAAGVFVGAMYMTSDGTSGTPGGNGAGGAGGGGGGGGTTDCDSSGSSGGGGGGGGCGGTNGTGGTGGGGSFGVVAVDSQVVLKGTTVMAGQGGNGGAGGLGGFGGIGGTGGTGGAYGGSSEQDDGGCGDHGGNGGNGGNGGTGGGGGGGPSAAAVCVGSATITIPQSMLNGGTGGTGGTSAVAAGANGVSTLAIGCNFF
jgi:hypothetical protein